MRCAAAVCLFLIVPLPVTAQEARATLLGLVSDATGSVLTGARLTATNIATEVRYSTDSNGDGNYVIPYLPPGEYRLRVEREGFRIHERPLVLLRTGDRVRIDVVMAVGWVTESVVVIADPPPFESAGASLGSLVDARRCRGAAYRPRQPVSPGSIGRRCGLWGQRPV